MKFFALAVTPNDLTPYFGGGKPCAFIALVKQMVCQFMSMGTDVSKTVLISTYLGARIGSQNGNALQITEIHSYGITVNNVQRKYVVDQLLTKYAL